MSRPSLLSEALVDEICSRLADGESLVQVCRDESMPNRATVLRWIAAKPDIATKFDRARQGQADFLLDDIARVEASAECGDLPSDVARVLISSKQWRAMKLAPKKYGDKTTIEASATVTVQQTRRLDISTLTDDQLDALEGALRETVAQLEAPTIEHE